MRTSIKLAAMPLVLLAATGSWPNIGDGAPLPQTAERPNQRPEAESRTDLPSAENPQTPPTRTLSPPAEDQSEAAPQRSAYGGNFGGTFAYDPQVGYDYGQHDDNGRDPEYYLNNRGRGPRLPGKRPDPGDWDFFDAYQQGILYDDGSLGDYDDLGSYREFHGGVGRDRYWRSRGFIPLRYDDFGEYQRFHYELGGRP